MPGPNDRSRALDEQTVRALWASSSPQARAYYARQLRWGQPAYDRPPIPRGRTAICADPRCARVFTVQQLPQRFCCLDCGRRANQRRRYWTNPSDRARRRADARARGAA